jgi:hypothetical protein
MYGLFKWSRAKNSTHVQTDRPCSRRSASSCGKSTSVARSSESFHVRPSSQFCTHTQALTYAPDSNAETTGATSKSTSPVPRSYIRLAALMNGLRLKSRPNELRQSVTRRPCACRYVSCCSKFICNFPKKRRIAADSTTQNHVYGRFLADGAPYLYGLYINPVPSCCIVRGTGCFRSRDCANGTSRLCLQREVASNRGLLAASQRHEGYAWVRSPARAKRSNHPQSWIASASWVADAIVDLLK